MTQKLLYGVLTASLMLLLQSCGSHPTQTAPLRDLPPEYLLIDTPVPAPAGRKNSDLAKWAPELYCALMQSNADKAALRAWREGKPYTADALTCE
jgi:hypothetical protein